MNVILKRLAAIPVFALAFFLWSCDDIGQATGPASGVAPSEGAVFSSTSGRKYVVARDKRMTGTVTATIGPRGGELKLEKHRLLIPKDAVEGPTVFTMTYRDSELLAFTLSATVDEHNDIGSQGFPVPLQLEVDYDDLLDVPRDESVLTLVYFRPDGIVDELEVTVDKKGKRVLGKVNHFSGFGLAWPF